jgi:hypothetical protein
LCISYKNDIEKCIELLKWNLFFLR